MVFPLGIYESLSIFILLLVDIYIVSKSAVMDKTATHTGMQKTLPCRISHFFSKDPELGSLIYMLFPSFEEVTKFCIMSVPFYS